MTNIALLRVRYAAAFADALDGLGTSASKYLGLAGIDPELLEVREGYMPFRQLQRFAAIAARDTGIHDLGLRASLAPRKTHSGFSLKILHSPTLNQSLRSACEMSRTEDTSANLRLSRDGLLAWFSADPIRGSQEEVRQVELFRYGGMLQMIRYTAGAEWTAPVLRLQSIDDGKLDDVPLLRDTDVQFGYAHLTVGFPLRMLAERVDYDAKLDSIEAESPELVPALREDLRFEQAVKEVIRTQMLAHRSSVENTASALDLSVRSMQRKLANRRLSYRDLLEQIRIETAQARLDKTNSPLIDIAAALGYRHSTHFSRAFRRVCGMSPSEYRQISQN